MRKEFERECTCKKKKTHKVGEVVPVGDSHKQGGGQSQTDKWSNKPDTE